MVPFGTFVEFVVVGTFDPTRPGVLPIHGKVVQASDGLEAEFAVGRGLWCKPAGIVTLYEKVPGPPRFFVASADVIAVE